MNKKLWFTLMSLVFFVSMGHAASLDKIAVVVNNEVITESQINQQVQNAQQQGATGKDIREKVIEHLSDQSVQLQLAKVQGIQITDEMVKQAILGIAEKNGLTQEQLQEVLQKQGLSFERYKKDIKNQMTINQLQQREFSGKIKINDQDVAALARILAKNPRTDAEYHVADLLLPFPDGANEGQIAAKRKEAEALVIQLRKDPGTKLESPITDLGMRKLADLPELFIKPVQAMRQGEFTGPIQAPNGFHILHLIAVQGDVISHQQTITETEVRHIFMKPGVVATAANIKRRLDNIRRELEHGGGDFSKLAAQYSQDLNSSQKGGNLGWIKPGMYDPIFEQVVAHLQPGQISQPFSTPAGWHLVQVLNRREVHEKKDPFNEMARQQLYGKKAAEVLKVWLKQLRADAYIKRY